MLEPDRRWFVSAVVVVEDIGAAEEEERSEPAGAARFALSLSAPGLLATKCCLD
jgi:hypothetical protein